MIRPKEGGGHEVLRESGGDELAMLERDVQKIVENNLQDIFGLEFLSHEFSVGGQRLDTVAFERDAASFVIIEYKKKTHRGALEQGLSYHALLAGNKEAFYDMYKKSSSDPVAMEDVRFDDTRIIVIAPGFTEHQLNGVESAPQGSALYRVAEYADGTIALCRVCSDPSGRALGEGYGMTEEQHLEGRGSAGLYHALKERLSESLDLEVLSRKSYIGFRSKGNSALICAVRPGQDDLNLEYTTTDPKVIQEDGEFVKRIARNKKYESRIAGEDDIDRAIPLIKKVFESKGR